MTSVELLPIHAHVDETHLVRAGRTNYWGYNTLSFFCPDPRFVATGSRLDPAAQFKTMVRALHAAGIEVILDMVYNHTAETDHLGPTLSWRGIDNATYYRLLPGRRSRYQDFTGCGNTFNMQSSIALGLMMDSLRYWAEEMHVDGFRFDLATALARESHAYDIQSGFFDVLHQDPVLSRLKLIAEPWDLGDGGYQVGGFPHGWREWNGKYRDGVRRFWRDDAGMLPELATRLSGSSDLYGPAGRQPISSVNFVTSHDGFTLADLVAYNDKHNDANGEQNRDGETHNFSWNCGVEGPTDDAGIRALRLRQRRNLMATLFTSLGVPMLSGGDERGRTQLGNNNGYCHDSALTWTDWTEDGDERAFQAFVAALVKFRRDMPVFRRRQFLRGRNQDPADVLWLRPDGHEMTPTDWANDRLRALGMLLNGRAIAERGPDGEPQTSETALVLYNGGDRDVIWALPPRGRKTWQVVCDTAEDAARQKPAGHRHTTIAHSVTILRTL